VCFVGEGGSATLEVSSDFAQATRNHRLVDPSNIVQAECARFVADRKVGVERLLAAGQADEANRVFDRQTSGKDVFLSF